MTEPMPAISPSAMKLCTSPSGITCATSAPSELKAQSIASMNGAAQEKTA